MKRTGTALVVLLLVNAFSGNIEAGFADPLWEGAVGNFVRHDQVYARQIETEAAEYDGRGNRRAFRETAMAVTLDGDGRARSELTAVRDNGTAVPLADVITSASAAVTADNSEAAAAGREAALGIMHLSPFDPRLQDNVRYRRVSGPPGVAAATAAVEFAFTLETPTQLISGSAWLRAHDGIPLRSVATVEPLPRFVRELSVEQIFAESEAGHHVSEVRIKADGGFLFFRRRSEITMRFLDHARAIWPQTPGEAGPYPRRTE